jgi:hypothetical protein
VQVGNLPKRRRWRRRRTAGGVSWCCSRMANPAPKSKEEENKRIKRQEHALRFINCAKSTYPLRTSICPLWKWSSFTKNPHIKYRPMIT